MLLNCHFKLYNDNFWLMIIQTKFLYKGRPPPEFEKGTNVVVELSICVKSNHLISRCKLSAMWYFSHKLFKNSKIQNNVKSLIEAPPQIEAQPELRPSLRFENRYQDNFEKF